MTVREPREKIYRILESNGPLMLSELGSQARLDQSAISLLLSGLMDDGRVSCFSRRTGNDCYPVYYHVTDRSYCSFIAELAGLLDPLVFALDAAGEMDLIARKHGVFLDNYLADGYSITFGDTCITCGFFTKEIKYIMGIDDWNILVDKAGSSAGIPLKIIEDFYSDTIADDLGMELGINVTVTAEQVTFLSTAHHVKARHH